MRRWRTGICLIILVIVEQLQAVHHWRIRDDGKGYEPVYDSPFVLARKHGMTHVLQQEEDVNTLGKSLVEVSDILKSVKAREKFDEPDIEEKIRESSADCAASGDTEFQNPDFFARFPHEGCKEFHDLFPEVLKEARSQGTIPPTGLADFPLPFCHELFPEFARSAEFLNEQRPSQNLTNDLFKTSKEDDATYVDIANTYFKGILSELKEGSTSYGNQLAWLLKRTKLKSHPYAHMAAAAYFRANGAPYWAFTCYNTASELMKDKRWQSDKTIRNALNDALHSSTVSLLFHIGKHEDGLKIFASYYGERKNVNDPRRPACFNIAATALAGDMAYLSAVRSGKEDLLVENLSRAKKHYQDAIAIAQNEGGWTASEVSSKWPQQLASKTHWVGCQLDISNAIYNQLDNIANYLHETTSLASKQDFTISVEERIAARLPNSADIASSELLYEEHRYGPNPYRKCRMTMTRRKDPFSGSTLNARQYRCRVAKKEYEAYRKSMDEVMRSEDLGKQPIEEPWKVTEVFTTDHAWIKKMKRLQGHAIDSPQWGTKYPLDNSTYNAKDSVWRRADWPSAQHCRSLWWVGRCKSIFNQDVFPQAFLPLEDKGYNVAEYVTKWIGVEDNENHPFPWDAPDCAFVDFKHGKTIFDRYKSIHIIDNMQMVRDKRYAEDEMSTILTRLAGKIMDEHEMGGRINTLLQYDIGPRWLVLNLAALYWRLHGCPKCAVHCLMGSVLAEPRKADVALIQLAQVVLRATKKKEDALEFLRMATAADGTHPMTPWLMGRLKLLMLDFDGAVYNFKDSLDKNPFDERVLEDLLTLKCSGKSSKPIISTRFPTVCCSPIISNAVCFGIPGVDENCYVMGEDGRRLVYSRCNGNYTGKSNKSTPFANIVSPFLPIFQTAAKRDTLSFDDDLGGVMGIETDELSLESGGADHFFIQRPIEWWGRAKNEMVYKRAIEKQLDYWEIDAPSALAQIPPKPLSHLWVNKKEDMIAWDISRPELVPKPSLHQIRTGLGVFPPPRQTASSCSNVPKLPTLLELQASTWVSVTAKGEDIERHVDLKGPVPSIAGLVPNCPVAAHHDMSPVLAMDHLPVFTLSDQFLFYKAEKTLTDALKSIGAEKDTIEHVAARLHTAILANGIKNGKVNWLLCVLSSLYWRVVGDAPKAMGCLRTALITAPPDKRDIVLISIANIAYQAGLMNSALSVSAAALTISPNLVATHFTIGNIYASMGEYQQAIEFYYSTLALQSNFEPAKDRIRAILCHSGEKFDFHYLF